MPRSIQEVMTQCQHPNRKARLLSQALPPASAQSMPIALPSAVTISFSLLAARRISLKSAARLKSTGRRIETIAADLTKAEDVRRIAERLRTDPTITALVNNAGLGSAGKLLDSNIDDLESMIYLNVTALTRLALAALPGFVARKNGLLINIASVVALAPDLLNGTYSGTKAYVVNFTQALKNELEGKGVTVQAVLPGATATPFWAKAGRPVEDLPSEIVMAAEDMVDASLAGLDQHEADYDSSPAEHR